jgi:hypothetical protein
MRFRALLGAERQSSEGAVQTLIVLFKRPHSICGIFHLADMSQRLNG